MGGAQGRAPLPGLMGGVDASPPGRADAGRVLGALVVMKDNRSSDMRTFQLSRNRLKSAGRGGK